MTTLEMTPEYRKAPTWLRVVAAIGVVWYAFGLIQFWLGYSMDTQQAIAAGAISVEHGAAIDGTPLAIWIAFAIASAAGLIGSVWLFFGTATAKQAFILSLAAAALYYTWVYALSGTGADRPSEELIIASVVGAVTLAFYIVSRRLS